MSAPEEIVCETEEAFNRACLQYSAATEWPYLRPGQVTHGTVIAPVRIVYRPPPPLDEAREAWSSRVLQRFLPTSPALSSDANVNLLREAFMSGRASVKP